MAFVTTVTPLRTRRFPSLRRPSLESQTHTGISAVPKATAVQSNHRVPVRKNPKPRSRTSAQVVDSRVACRHEVHHWIVVKGHSKRMFERAAVAQTDVTRQLEARGGPGALHRWVLREVSDQLTATSNHFALGVGQGNTQYVVMESFDQRTVQQSSSSLTHRWLSAVERVGPLISAVDIHTLQYSDVFTSKRHDVVFNPRENIVVLETINLNSLSPEIVSSVVEALRAKAERSVSVGDCLEFCVLQSMSQASLLKTVEIYKNMEALRFHIDGLDKKYMHRVLHHTMNSRRNRQVFKPVVFS